MCQVGGHVDCKKTITMTNGGGYLTPSAVKNPPNFMVLLNQDVPEVVSQNPIMQSLQCTLARGDKMFTGQAEENLDMMFTKLLMHEDKNKEW